MNGIKTPERCVFEPGYACNLKCLACNLWKEEFYKLKTPPGNEPDAGRAAEIQQKLAEDGVKKITYIGGEPFANPWLPETALRAKELGMRTAVVTNGTLLDEKLIGRICGEGVFDVMIFSIDGPEKVHDALRGAADAFGKAEKNLKFLSRLKRREKLKKPKIMIYSTLSSLNHSFVEKIYGFAKRVNAAKIRFQLASFVQGKTPGNLGSGSNLHQYSPPENLKIPGSALPRLREKILRLKESSAKDGLRVEAEKKLAGKKNERCRFLFNDCVVNSAGDVIPCPMAPGFSAGNVLSGGLRRAFAENAEKIKNLENSPLCRQCCVEKIW